MVTTYEEKKQFPYSVEQLFELVMDIERYPEFLPWAKAARIIERHHDHLIADLLVSFKGVDEQYRSHVSFAHPSRIEVKQVEGKGPFATLFNSWNFTSTEEGAELHFYIEFEFRNFLLRSLMGTIFTNAQHTMIEAFIKRANQLYS